MLDDRDLRGHPSDNVHPNAVTMSTPADAELHPGSPEITASMHAATVTLNKGRGQNPKTPKKTRVTAA